MKILKVFFCLLWVFLSFFLNSSFVGAHFQIVEVMPNTLDDKNLEYITLQNTSSGILSLSGYILSDKKKDFIFSSGITLESQEKRQFFRPETKLVLNNSDEKLTLKNPAGEIVSEVEYASSTKGNFLSFEVIHVNEGEQIISQEYIWEEIISNEIEILSPEVTKSQGVSETGETLLVPEIVFGLQQPSYLSQSGSSNIYVCDNSKEICKVNFDLRPSFSEQSPERDYVCDIDFGFGEATGQEERCNPNTVIFPKGEYQVIFTIFHEDDRSIFSQKKIVIQNLSKIEDTPEEHGTNIQQNTENKEDTGSGGESSSIKERRTPEIVFQLQRPSYVTQSGSSDIFLCDDSKNECKVNFDLDPSFSEAYPERDYICEIDFGFGKTTGEEHKCNPNTVMFPEGISDVYMKIYHEDDPSIVSESHIEIHNFSKQVSSGSSSTSTSTQRVNTSKISLVQPRIIVQSGLNGSGIYFRCKKQTCTINLKYEKRHKNERCIWSFGVGKYSSPQTYKRCNPGYVSYPLGEHELALEIYEKNNRPNRKIFRFYVSNTGDVSETEEKILKEDDTKIIEDFGENQILNPSIILQGRQTKSQIRGVSGVLCQGVKKCYLNFSASGFSDSKKYSYLWSDNGTLFSEKYNPGGEWFEAGKHEIKLSIFQEKERISETIFQVLVHEDILVASNIDTGISKKSQKQKKIKKDFTQNFFPLKYDGLRISGKAPLGSRVEVFLGDKILGRVITNEKGRYRIVTKNIQAGEHNFSTKIIYVNGEEKWYRKSGEYELLTEKRAFWFVSKKSRRKSSSKTKKIFTPELIVQAHADASFDRASQEAELSLQQKIFFYAITVLAALAAVLHMIFRQIEGMRQTSFVLCHSVRFATKQRVNLLVG